MSAFMAELIGTAILILLGDGVVANVVLKQTKGSGSGWIVITWGWAMAVFVAVFCVAPYSGAHINPIVTIGLAVAGKFPWAQVPTYLVAQFLGGALGAFLMWVHFYPHFAITSDTKFNAVFRIAGPVQNTASFASWFSVTAKWG